MYILHICIYFVHARKLYPAYWASMRISWVCDSIAASRGVKYHLPFLSKHHFIFYLLPKIHQKNQNLRILQVTLSRDFYLDAHRKHDSLASLAPSCTAFVKLTAQTSLVFFPRSRHETVRWCLLRSPGEARSTFHFPPFQVSKKNWVWARQMIGKNFSA